MESISPKEQEANATTQKNPRNREWLHLQVHFLEGVWLPKCAELGISREQAGLLLHEWFAEWGDTYRKSSMTPEHFWDMMCVVSLGRLEEGHKLRDCLKRLSETCQSSEPVAGQVLIVHADAEAVMQSAA